MLIFIFSSITFWDHIVHLWHVFPHYKVLFKMSEMTSLPFILFLAMTVTTNTSGRPNISLVHIWKSIKKLGFFCKKENSALLEHTCLINHTVGWDKSKIITTNWSYHQCLCLEAWHMNSTHAPLNHDDGSLLPNAYLHLVRKKEKKKGS